MIIKKRDNTFLIDGEAGDPLGPYHIVSQDPKYAIILEKIAAGAEWEWELEPLSEKELNRIKFSESWKEQQYVVTRSILDERLSNGFPFQDKVIQADPVALQNANGFLTVITAGIDPLPIVWRTKDNTNITFTDADSFKVFAAQMLIFVQEEFHNEWAAKDAIRAAIDFDTAWNAFIAYRGY